jgi:hypothetical protein
VANSPAWPGPGVRWRCWFVRLTRNSQNLCHTPRRLRRRRVPPAARPASPEGSAIGRASRSLAGVSDRGATTSTNQRAPAKSRSSQRASARWARSPVAGS